MNLNKTINFLKTLYRQSNNVYLWTTDFTDYAVPFSDIPKAELRFGKNLDTDDIKEGDDAYFECHVEARPEVTKIEWFHNVSNCSITRYDLKVR